MTRLFVAADDRTGALETAGMCAELGSGDALCGSAAALASLSSSELAACGTVVVDLGSRHLEPQAAAGRAADLSRLVAAERYAHKIDSTLRGNWAIELVARERASNSRVLLVPAFPALGRTCSDGLVSDHGRPVAHGHAGSDPRSPIRSSRPLDHLQRAGAAAVESCSNSQAVSDWLRSGEEPFAVCDASTNADLDAVGRAWVEWGDDVVLAGTAAAIAVASGRFASSGASQTRTAGRLRSGAVLVICASLNAVSRRQIGALVDGGASIAVVDPSSMRVDDGPSISPSVDGRVARSDDGIVAVLAALRTGGIGVLSSAELDAVPSVGPNVGHEDHALAVGRLGREIASTTRLTSVVLIGGDTAEAFLGDRAAIVTGTVGVGIPIATMYGSSELDIVTKAGGFGDTRTLVDLLGQRDADDDRTAGAFRHPC